MKRKLTFLLTLVMAFSMIIASVLPTAAAENTVQPRLSNADTATVSFVIDNGVGYFAVTYNGNEGVFTQAKVSVTVQKRFLLVFWNDVDSWTGTSNNPFDEIYANFDIEKTGTYRAVYTLEFYGTSGVVDVIEDKIEYKYE